VKVRLTIAAQGARQPAMFGEIRMIALRPVPKLDLPKSP
jgi:hypothetical protein